ncbi:twinkle-like protein [Tenacibaculum phage Larrie]|nr:twinkle-like protein [Tenacibaculum phage Larrie]
MILERAVSFFKRTTDTIVNKTISIEEMLISIKDGTYKREIERLRAGNKDVKRMLPMVAAHGLFETERKKAQFYESSGIIILDIDDVEDDLEEVKEDIIASNSHVLAAMISPSGDGIKVLYLVNKDYVSSNNYRAIGKKIVSEFDIYGKVDFLSVTDCLIMTYDPKIQIDETAEPALIYCEDTFEVKSEPLEPLDESRELWEDAEDFFDTVLAEDIASKTSSNFHFIQVSVLDMAKFGFFHPQEDLSFIVDYAESYFKRSSENGRRLDEIAYIANNTVKQSKHPYKTFSGGDYEEEDEPIDYSQYQEGFGAAEDLVSDEGFGKPEDSEKDDLKDDNEDEGINTPKKKEKASKRKKKGEEEEIPDEDNYGLVDYSKHKERVIQKIREGDRVGFEISLSNIADIFRFNGTGILTVTGIPSHGKTELVDVATLDLARLYGQDTFIVGFEQTSEEHIIKLVRKMIGTNITCESWFNESNYEAFDKAYDFVTNHIKHIDVNSIGGNINLILGILAKRIFQARREGRDPKYVVIDPFNMLSIKGRYSGHEKIEEILRRITHFSHQMGVMVILVAHPFKMKVDEKTGAYAVPDFYSVKGSSAFYEMSYHGMVVYRKQDNTVLVRILKVKQNNLGEKDAEAYFTYDRPSGRYIPIDEQMNELSGDHREPNWQDKVQ